MAWNLLCAFVKELSAPPSAIDGVLLKTTLGLKLLAGAGLITDEKIHERKTKKILTGLVYKQQKYNLLREETEGYSKLAVVLCSIPSYPEDVSQCVRQVLSLIGRFELDPNRALDVILDAFEQQIWNLSFLQLLKLFSRNNIPHILGFKFTFYHNAIVEKEAEIIVNEPAVNAVVDKQITKGELAGKAKDFGGPLPKMGITNIAPTLTVPKTNSNNNPPATTPAATITASTTSSTVPAISVSESYASSTPASLYALTALLLAADLVTIKELLPYLQPSLEETALVSIAIENALVKSIKSHGQVNLSSLDSTGTALGSAGLALTMGMGMGGSSSQLNVPAPPMPFSLQGSGSGLGLGQGSNGYSVAPIGGFGLPIAPALGSFPVPAAPFGVNRRFAPGTESKGKEVNKDINTGSILGIDVKGKKIPESKEPEPLIPEVLFADGNQIVGLISALLSVRCWTLAHSLILLLENQSSLNSNSNVSSIDVMRFESIREALCEFLLWSTETIYQPYSFSKLNLSLKSTKDYKIRNAMKNPGIDRLLKENETGISLFKNHQMSQYSNLRTFVSDITPVLLVARHHVSTDTTLYIRLCRLLEAHIKLVAPLSSTEKSSGVKVVKNDKDNILKEDELVLQPTIEILSNVLLPSLTVSKSNPTFSRQLWRVVMLLPFQIRYSLYDNWRGEGLGKDGLGHKNSQIVMAETIALSGAKYLFKRLAKENVATIGAQLNYFSELAPVAVYNHVST